ncbi:hypothetical protein CHS0354_018877 [Potamilus streckersoni]|uniref:Uncharacterized protein n=1 Tax=Potamilus streckersoni TaxID=2493646 RepID=A0AAE0VT78_9BIVA|nr:hypothetical protein CHS0354_018877 [Potamilus streckersoni]
MTVTYNEANGNLTDFTTKNMCQLYQFAYSLVADMGPQPQLPNSPTIEYTQPKSKPSTSQIFGIAQPEPESADNIEMTTMGESYNTQPETQETSLIREYISQLPDCE